MSHVLQYSHWKCPCDYAAWDHAILRLDAQCFVMLLLKEEMWSIYVVQNLVSHYGTNLGKILGKGKKSYEKMSLKGRRSFDQWCVSMNTEVGSTVLVQ